jgi:hypothetical protein
MAKSFELGLWESSWGFPVSSILHLVTYDRNNCCKINFHKDGAQDEEKDQEN